jgi:hypothetical protein
MYERCTFARHARRISLDDERLDGIVKITSRVPIPSEGRESIRGRNRLEEIARSRARSECESARNARTSYAAVRNFLNDLPDIELRFMALPLDDHGDHEDEK